MDSKHRVRLKTASWDLVLLVFLFSCFFSAGPICPQSHTRQASTSLLIKITHFSLQIKGKQWNAWPIHSKAAYIFQQSRNGFQKDHFTSQNKQRGNELINSTPLTLDNTERKQRNERKLSITGRLQLRQWLSSFLVFLCGKRY